MTQIVYCAVRTECLKMTQMVLGLTSISKAYTAYVIRTFVFIFIIHVLQSSAKCEVHLYVRILFLDA